MAPEVPVACTPVPVLLGPTVELSSAVLVTSGLATPAPAAVFEVVVPVLELVVPEKLASKVPDPVSLVDAVAVELLLGFLPMAQGDPAPRNKNRMLNRNIFVRIDTPLLEKE